MANVNGRISLGVYDANGGRSNFLTHVVVSDAQTLANAVTGLATVATLFGTVSDGGIRDATFSLVSEAVAANPGADADVGSGAVFDFSNTADGTINGIWIPSFLDSLKGPGKAIDITGTVQAAFVSAMVGAIMGGRYTNGANIPNAVGTKAFRASRKLGF